MLNICYVVTNALKHEDWYIKMSASYVNLEKSWSKKLFLRRFWVMKFFNRPLLHSKFTRKAYTFYLALVEHQEIQNGEHWFFISINFCRNFYFIFCFILFLFLVFINIKFFNYCTCIIITETYRFINDI